MVEETIPPIIGTAMRCITSEPEPVLQRIGTMPAMIRDHRRHLRVHPLDRAEYDRLFEALPDAGPTTRRPTLFEFLHSLIEFQHTKKPLFCLISGTYSGRVPFGIESDPDMNPEC
jgi:hypothetical protein